MRRLSKQKLSVEKFRNKPESEKAKAGAHQQKFAWQGMQYN